MEKDNSIEFKVYGKKALFPSLLQEQEEKRVLIWCQPIKR